MNMYWKCIESSIPPQCLPALCYVNYFPAAFFTLVSCWLLAVACAF